MEKQINKLLSDAENCEYTQFADSRVRLGGFGYRMGDYTETSSGS